MDKVQVPNKREASLWRLILGVIFTGDGARGLVTGSPPLNPPANIYERVTLGVANTVFLLLGVWLVLTFIQILLKNRRNSLRVN